LRPGQICSFGEPCLRSLAGQTVNENDAVLVNGFDASAWWSPYSTMVFVVDVGSIHIFSPGSSSSELRQSVSLYEKVVHVLPEVYTVRKA
jgi:hypothetical protein